MHDVTTYRAVRLDIRDRAARALAAGHRWAVVPRRPAVTPGDTPADEPVFRFIADEIREVGVHLIGRCAASTATISVRGRSAPNQLLLRP
jgi:hypothetical protein